LLGGKPKLLQRAQIIVCFPLLDYLAVLEAVDGDALEFKLSTSGRAKLLRLSLVGAAYGVAANHLITLGYQIFNGDVEVGEGLALAQGEPAAGEGREHERERAGGFEDRSDDPGEGMPEQEFRRRIRNTWGA